MFAFFSKIIAFFCSSLSCPVMNCQIYTTVTCHFFIGCIDNSINLHFGYVLPDYLKGHSLYLFSVLNMVSDFLSKILYIKLKVYSI